MARNEELWKKRKHEWYLRNKDITCQRDRKRKKALQKWLDDYKSQHPCIICGETVVGCIEFHHIDSSTKNDTVSNILKNIGSIAAMLKEIEKCVPLCANCHRKYHIGEGDESDMIRYTVDNEQH